jgi:hypothetical protein
VALLKTVQGLTAAGQWLLNRLASGNGIEGVSAVSTTDQDLSIQQVALKAVGCHVIRAEKQSGTSTKGRTELRTVLDFIGNGDVLMVTAWIAWHAPSATCRTSSARSRPRAQA